MRFRFQDEAVDLQSERPLIEVDTEQRVIVVSVNHRSMQTPTPTPGIERFYEAYQTFRECLSAPDAVMAITLRPGDLIVFDNRRVLHGRTGVLHHRTAASSGLLHRHRRRQIACAETTQHKSFVLTLVGNTASTRISPSIPSEPHAA